jgi:hypothetical protein
MEHELFYIIEIYCWHCVLCAVRAQNFRVRSQNCEKGLLISSCLAVRLSVRLSVRMEQLGSY